MRFTTTNITLLSGNYQYLHDIEQLLYFTITTLENVHH